MLLAVAVFASGCLTLGRALSFGEQAEEVRQTARIDGRVDTEGPAEGVLVVALAAVGDDGELTGVDSSIRLEPGSYAFPVQAGRYQLGAYEDRNANGLLDPGERVVRNRDGRVIELQAGQRVTENITIRRPSSDSDLQEPIDVLGLIERTPKEQREFSLWAWSVEGEIAGDLDDPRFGPEAGESGLWKIMDFLHEGYAGIYFVEPYDRERTPVLFVHGIGGYPRQFSSMIENLDRTRFQPWFYFYPSGFSLDGISGHLATLLERVQARRRFGALAIVAHSMGGLVSRGAVLKYAEETGRDDVRILISVSTPWGGDVHAASAKDAPIALPPSFADMSPSSDYLKWLFYRNGDQTPRSLPPNTEHHLLFGFHMSSSHGTADDGTVTLASQLRPIAQKQASSRYGYDYGHTEILHAPEVLSHINRLLEARFD